MVTPGVHNRSINDVQSSIKGRFADYKKAEWCSDTPEEQGAIQRDLDKMKE